MAGSLLPLVPVPGNYSSTKNNMNSLSSSPSRLTRRNQEVQFQNPRSIPAS